MPDCSLETEETGGFLCGFFFFTNYENRLFQKQNLPAYIGMKKQRTELGVIFSELRACKC